MTQPNDAPISTRMKEGCADLHEKAEHAEIPSRMVRGEMSRDEFARMIQQEAIWNRALDDALLEHRETNPYIKSLVSDEQLQGQYFDEDLDHYGLSRDTQPSPAIKSLLDTIEEARKSDPLTLLGLHYVREGANNGNHYVAKKLRAAWGQEGDEGLRSLDPYGKEQRKLWEQFKVKLDEQPFTPEEKDAMVRAGRTMFERITAIHEEMATTGASS